MKSVLFILASIMFFSPFLTGIAVEKGVLPEPDDFDIEYSPPIESVSDLRNLVANIVGWVYVIFFIIAVFFILLAAFNYLTAGDDTEKTKKARQMLIYAVIAITIALLATMVSFIIAEFLRNPLAGSIFISVAFAVPVPGTIPTANQIGIKDAPNITNEKDLVKIIADVIGWTYTIFFIIAVFFILLAAFNYLTAGDDTEKTKKARQMLIYAVIAITIALLAVMVNTIVKKFLGGYGGGGENTGSYTPGLTEEEQTNISGSYPTEYSPTGVEN